MSTSPSQTLSAPTTTSDTQPGSALWARTTAVAGLVFFLLIIAFSSLTSGTPAASDSRLEV